jgi:hypothetical protein
MMQQPIPIATAPIMAGHAVVIDRNARPTADSEAVEAYCVDSGRAVRWEAGDRCLHHGAADVPCVTALRVPQCRHEHLSPNHPYPHCSECGRDL